MAMILLLWVLFAQTCYAAVRTSLTIDEGLHITSGYTILRTGDFRLVEEHPPLVKLLEALPLLLVPDLPPPSALPGWESIAPVTDSVRLVQAAQALIYPYHPLDRLVVAARLPVALLGILLGAIVFRWALDLGGWNSGLLALFLLTFDPNILAHAAVAGTDLGAACFITATLFLFSRFTRRPSMTRLTLTGVALGAALGSKLSSVLLLPVLAALLIWMPLRRRTLRFTLLLLIAGLVLWSIYGFEMGGVTGIPLPVPAASYAIPWLRLRQHIADGHAAFLLGKHSSRGWWYYFPVAFALKTPLPTLFLLLLSIAYCVLPVRHRPSPILLLFPLVYGASSLFSSLNIGYRHLLPILPLLIIQAGQIADRVSRIAYRIGRVMLAISLIYLAVSTLRLSPHYLAYFNELAGGPDEGWRYLADSNTDWGQAYKDLARFQRERGVSTVRLSAFIFYDPAIYGVVYEPLTPMRGDTPAVFPSRFNPPPGDYIISATTLDGIPLADPEMYDWFRKREPDARIGHVLFYYHIPPAHPTPTWLAQCTVPAAPIPPAAVAEGFGRDDLRLAYFDCTQAWLYPAGGQSAGWYAFHRDSPVSEDRFARDRLAGARLSFEQKRRTALPPLFVFEWPAAGIPPLSGATVWAAPSEWPPPQAIAAGAALSLPVALDGVLTLRGYDMERAEHAIAFLTYWQVGEEIARPFSLMAHLVDPAGHPVAVGDGLGVAWDQLQPGDLLVQRHWLPAGSELSDGIYWLQSGAYWLDTMERFPVVAGGAPVGDRVLLGQIEVP